MPAFEHWSESSAVEFDGIIAERVAVDEHALLTVDAGLDDTLVVHAPLRAVAMLVDLIVELKLALGNELGWSLQVVLNGL